MRDSLREEIFQNLNENLTEHEVVRWTVTGLPLTAHGLQGDTVEVERVTERTRSRDNIATYKTKKEDVRTVVMRDTVYVERRDSVSVESLELTSLTFGAIGCAEPAHARQSSSKLYFVLAHSQPSAKQASLVAFAASKV